MLKPDEFDDIAGTAFNIEWDGHDVQVVEQFRCTTEEIGALVRDMLLRGQVEDMRALITKVGEEPPATATAPWLAARLLRLVFLSSSLRHHLEDKILGTSTGAARLASGHNADGYVLDDSDSKENQLSKAVSRKSALTPNARSTRSAPRVGADDRARGGRELVSLTVVALKERCAAAGLKKTGRKADLIARLRAHAEAADGEQR